MGKKNKKKGGEGKPTGGQPPVPSTSSAPRAEESKSSALLPPKPGPDGDPGESLKQHQQQSKKQQQQPPKQQQQQPPKQQQQQPPKQQQQQPPKQEQKAWGPVQSHAPTAQQTWGAGQSQRSQQPAQQGRSSAEQQPRDPAQPPAQQEWSSTEQKQPRGPGRQQQRPREPAQQGQSSAASTGQQPGGAGQSQHGQQQARHPGQQQQSSTASITSSMSTLNVASQYSIQSKSAGTVAFNWCGKAGKSANMEVNYLKLDITKMPNVAYHYDVQFDPERPLRLRQPAFEQLRTTALSNMPLAFDGRCMAYSANKKIPLPWVTQHTVRFIDPDTNVEKEFKITIKETVDSEIDMTVLRNYHTTGISEKPLRALQCIDVVLRSACYGRSKQAGRAFYIRPQQPVDLQDGYELWLGLFQSAILGQYPLVNIDVAHKGFPVEINAADAFKNMQNPADYFRGLNLIYNPPACMNGQRKLYKIVEIKQSAREQTFLMEDGTRMTVEQYYESKNYRLRFPELPCLSVSRIRSLYFPAELCLIPAGQTVLKKAGANQVRAMIKAAATSTEIRKQKIFQLFRTFDHNRNEIIRGFNLTLGSEFIKVLARVINPPKLQYSNLEIYPQGGSWRPNNPKYLHGAQMMKWAILVVDRKRMNDSKVRDFAERISKEAVRLNMRISNEPIIRQEMDQRNLERQLIQLKNEQVAIAFVIITGFGDSYSKVKQTAEIRCGVLTQCIKANTLLYKTDPSTISNILLKVNSKLNGINHKLVPSPEVKVLQECIMFLGADVTHPSPDQRDIPSVVGVVASHDSFAFQYNICWRLQDPRAEMIADMENIVCEQLKYFEMKRKELPTKIIYYRDGVSDGQFEQLREIELNAINRACAKTKNGYRPKVTCLVVQKRHHTRFFPIRNDRTSFNINPRDRFFNCPPGTIVDTTITHPGEKQFFLLSHESIQGTAKPAKYCIIRDDSNFNPDELEALTYYLCHMFTRCNRSVSYPAPAYYAHLVAARGRVYIEGSRVNNDDLSREYRNRIVKREIIHDFPMYFV